MGPDLPTNWQEELARLRREQNPGKYNPTTEWPALRLPIPTGEPPQGWAPPPEEPEAPRVLILDL